MNIQIYGKSKCFDTKTVSYTHLDVYKRQLLQKTYVSDCISKRTIKNTGQLTMYLIQNHHEGIVSRDKFNAVQAEFARRNEMCIRDRFCREQKRRGR